MLFILKYFIKRLPREGFKTLSALALSLALVFLINVLGGINAQQQEEYDYMLNDYDVLVTVCDLSGSVTQGLMLPYNIPSSAIRPRVRHRHICP